MKISELFKHTPRTFSFEFFPPKDEISAVDFGINVGQLLKLNPSFVSVTYGAGGSTQERTFALVDYLQNRIGLTTMAHYTCVNASRDKVRHDVQALLAAGIENLMLLRGDPPKGQATYSTVAEGFTFASEMIAYVKSFAKVSIGAAAYPEKHPEASGLDADIAHLRQKVEAGADFLLTQLFFDNEKYFNFINKAQRAGVYNRIIPGIIPLTSYSQIKRFTQMSGATIPPTLAESMERYANDPERMYRVGVEYSVAQCTELLRKGAPGIHFYTLNKSRATVEIYEELQRMEI